jgi:hypothetical protein
MSCPVFMKKLKGGDHSNGLHEKFRRGDRKKRVVERGRITPYTTKPNCYMDDIYLVDRG